MLKHSTVFVIGAGASFEFGLPIGNELAKRISKKMNVEVDRFNNIRSASGDADLFDLFRRAGETPLEYARAAWVIRDGISLASSIDDFLHVHRDDTFVIDYGKAAIAKCILEAEANSKLKILKEQRGGALVPTVLLSSCEDTWIVNLMRLLFRGTSKSDCARGLEKCTFIIFNYDRCIEHFFIHALKNAYDISPAEAAQIVANATFIHPYGSVGNINPTSPNQEIPFGHDHVDWLKVGRDSIKTYTEAVDDKQIKQAVVAASTIVFLGFAYHDQNMALLADREELHHKTIIGTTYEMSDNDVRLIKQQLAGWMAPQYQVPAQRSMFLENTTASKLLMAYAKSL